MLRTSSFLESISDPLDGSKKRNYKENNKYLRKVFP